MGARADGRRGTGDVPRAGAGGAFSSHGRLGVGRADAGMAVRGGVKLRGLEGEGVRGARARGAGERTGWPVKLWDARELRRPEVRADFAGARRGRAAHLQVGLDELGVQV